MITSVRFCLSYNLLNVILLPSKFVYFNENYIVVMGVCYLFLLKGLLNMIYVDISFQIFLPWNFTKD